MDDYIFTVNSGVFFTKGAVERANTLYSAYQSCPRLSARCSAEEVGGSFDDSTAGIDSGLFNQTFYQCEYTDIQISAYIEHRARLVILKNAIDYILYEKAGHMDRAGKKANGSWVWILRRLLKAS